MLVLRKLLQSMFPAALPRSCFISHSYADSSIVDELKQRLPETTSAYLFPPIEVEPDQRVSDDLVRAILDHPGLVYIDSEKSRASFWVAFERDFALRNKHAVFSYDPRSARFHRETSAPLDLRVFPSFARENEAVVEEIGAFMADKRSFSFWNEKDLIRPGEDIARRIDDEIAGTLASGGYTIAFLSPRSVESRWVQNELARSENWKRGRVLPALLEPVDISSLGPPLAGVRPVVLYQEKYGAINWNGVDDLIVRIYAMVYENTRGTLSNDGSRENS